jgi:tRNA (guanine-N7-)-methyltransferase
MTENNDIYNDNENTQYLNLPQKNKYRMHAHCNPLSIISIPYPFSPHCNDWSQHYPFIINNSKQQNKELHINTDNFPCIYHNETFTPTSTSTIPKHFTTTPYVNIVDIGCGYGGLLFNMSPHLSSNDLALGMEIRDKVTTFCGERIRTLRINSNHKEYNNISVVRTNTMKLLLNYFYKGQLDKLFFCFADPHFKKYNHRKRIINKYLLNDYSYVLKLGGKLYSITDVEELHNWHIEVLKQNPCFKEVSTDEVEKDECLQYMKNTDEARKVMKKNGKMYYAVYERVEPTGINSLYDLYNKLDYTNDD